jgi:multisubunit Na+/H+ antiporter MnhC subunit
MNDTLKQILTLTAIGILLAVFVVFVRVEQGEGKHAPYDKFSEVPNTP